MGIIDDLSALVLDRDREIERLRKELNNARMALELAGYNLTTAGEYARAACEQTVEESK